MSEHMAGVAEELVLDGTPSRKLPVQWGWRFVKECCGIRPSSKASVQLVRSFAVSVVALVVDFGSLVAFKEKLGMNYLLAATLSFSLGLLTNYTLSNLWVFAERKVADKRAEFVIFAIICAIGLALNLAVIAGMVQVLSVDYRVAKVVSAVLVFFWNFLARKKILY